MTPAVDDTSWSWCRPPAYLRFFTVHSKNMSTHADDTSQPDPLLHDLHLAFCSTDASHFRNPHTACLMGTGPCFLRQRSAHLILLSHLLLLLCVQPGARADNDTTCKLWQAPQPSTLYTWIASPSTRQRAQVMPGNQVWAAECPINPNLSHTEMDCPNSPLSPDATGQTCLTCTAKTITCLTMCCSVE